MVTVTQFIRNAALKSGVIPLAMGKSVKYEDRECVDVLDDSCYLCGGEIHDKGLPVKKAILQTFTDRDKARYPKSKSVCIGCAFCLSHRELRNYSIIATSKKIMHPDRKTIRQLLVNPPKPPFVFCVAVSGQKWVHFKSIINYDRENYSVQMEDTRINISVETISYLLPIIESLYSVFTKEEILTGRYGYNRIKQFGLKEYQMLEDKIAQYRGERIFELAVFVAQKPPEQPKHKEEDKCITTSIPINKEPQLQLF